MKGDYNINVRYGDGMNFALAAGKGNITVKIGDGDSVFNILTVRLSCLDSELIFESSSASDCWYSDLSIGKSALK
jgi:hypothetical protein